MVMVVCVEKGIEALFNLIGYDILVQFQAQAGVIIRLDHPFNIAVDGFLEDGLKRHIQTPL